MAIVKALGARETRWVAKRELLKVPLFGYGLRVTGQILVDRKDHTQALEALRANLGKHGATVVFFAEGERSAGGALSSFKKGGAAFAIDAPRTDGGAGNSDIWVQQVAGGTPLRLTTDPGRDDNPSFSSDGSRVIYHSSREGDGIFEVGTLGGGERLLGGSGFLPRCSPDGAWISYNRGPGFARPEPGQDGRGDGAPMACSRRGGEDPAGKQ